MRAPNSQRSLRAPSSSFVLISSSIILTILLIAPIPASTRSVVTSDHLEVQELLHGIVDEKLSSEIQSGASLNPDKNEHKKVENKKWAGQAEANFRKKDKDIKDSKDPSIISEFVGTKSGEASVKGEQAGIRRFDGVVASDEAPGKTSSGKNEKAQDRSDVNLDDGNIVVKGIIVRDDPVDAGTVNEAYVFSKINQRRKRSSEENSTKEKLEVSSGSVDAGKVSAVDSIESRRVPVLIPVGPSHAKPAKHIEQPPSKQVVPVLTENLAGEESSGQVEIKKGKFETDGKVKGDPELIGAHEAPIEELVGNVKSEVVPETKTVVIRPQGMGVAVESPEEAENARKSLLISDENAEDEKLSVEKADGLEQPKIQDSSSSSLENIVKTNVSLESLKLQAMSIQKNIKNETLLQRLKGEGFQVLPGIPRFNELQLLEALRLLSSKEVDEEKPEVSYLSKIDSGKLTDTQMKILRCTEALVVREQRQTFGENMVECIRGLSILNCMRIFVWPVIVDNMPESLSQNLPTLPIEVNVMDWLPGNQRVEPKSTRSRSTSSQQRLVTPELVVSGILKEALNAKPLSSESQATFIDPHNETLSKLLTPGQLDILKMAEKFLPETARQEFSNRMYSCVRRFEYFSCVKYFAWPMVKQHFSALPEFPDYQSWYPSVTLYPGYPVLPFPNSEGIGELPEVIEADATRTRRPRPEAVIVSILENTLKAAPNPSFVYQARLPEAILSPVTADQMAIFYLAEQLIPASMRQEFMSKTLNCIRDHDYLSCTKYATWPTVRQFVPSLPQFPDFSSWIPTFGVPDFSQYIPDFGSWFPGFPGVPGTTPTNPPVAQPDPQPAPQPIPVQPIPVQPIPVRPPATIISNNTVANNTSGSPTLLKEDQRVAQSVDPVEIRIMEILQNIKWTVLERNSPPASLPIQGNFTILNTLTQNQMHILRLSESVIPPQIRADLDARFVGCLQGGSNFVTCTRNIIWPTLQLYVKDLPDFPKEEKKPALESGLSESEQNLMGYGALKPGIYQPIAQQPQVRSPIMSQIVAEPEEAVPIARILQEAQISQETQQPIDRSGFAESDIPSAPVISITGTRFTPIFSDHPESVLLKILVPIQSPSKLAESSKTYATPEYLDSLKDYLNADQQSVIQVSEKLLPDSVKLSYIEKMSGCVRSSKFIVCSRDIVWPTLSQYYPALPSFPIFNIDESKEDLPLESTGSLKSIVSGVAKDSSAISETDVKTGQHGDAVVTITDTRFYPIFSQHPEAVILGILKNVQSSSPNLLVQQGSTKTATRSSDFVSSFTDQQGNIITISENLLPESIREVFTKRMTECVKENSFLACTRDIAWPTIAQFFPRLPNFPNIGALPEIAIEKPQQPTLLPPQLEPGPGLDVPAKSPIALEDPTLIPATQNLLPFVPEDLETRIESTLRHISSSGLYPQTKTSYLSTKDPRVVSSLTERQTNVIRMTEDMLPNAMKPLFVGMMVECTRGNVFAFCVRDIGWPMLRQFVPSTPNFPDLSNFGSYFPQIPQEIPNVPQFPDYQGQIPQVPNFPGFGFPGQGFGYPFRGAQDKNVPTYVREGSLFTGGNQPVGQPSVYIQGVRGITPSVGSYERSFDRGSSSDSSMVPRYPSKSGGLLSETIESSRRRHRRSLVTEPLEGHPNVSSDNNEQLKLNVTEAEFLQILINITKQSKHETRAPEVYFVDKLNSTVKQALTDEQVAILKVVEDISLGTTKAGFMSKVIQCITSLSFIRCMGIFVWPIITQNVPSLLGLPTLGSLNPFGRSQDNDSFSQVFGMTRTEFDRELVARKENIEGILIDWYRGIVEEEFNNDYGFLKIRGYGDGEIGISFNGLSREGRLAKIKDHKNLPSILTIISDIMEDVLDLRESRPDKDRKRDHKTGKRGKSIGDQVLDDYNKVSNDPENSTDSERSRNDDEIISMFLDKIKSNATNDNGENSNGKHYFSAEDAYEAFELLFGTRLSERMAERLNNLGNTRFRFLNHKKHSETHGESEENPSEARSSENNHEEKPKIRTGLTLRLPKIDEEFISRKVTDSLTSLGRKMKMEMSQLVPGITFAVSFFIQMFLSHARAAASIAGMMSNMALGSAILDMLRTSVFGPSTQPKIKYLYDNEVMGPGIVWPQQNHHG